MAHEASYIMNTGSFPVLKWPRRGADHPPHLAPRSKKEYSYTSTPPSGPSWPILGRTLNFFTPQSKFKQNPSCNFGDKRPAGQSICSRIYVIQAGKKRLKRKTDHYSSCITDSRLAEMYRPDGSEYAC